MVQTEGKVEKEMMQTFIHGNSKRDEGHILLSALIVLFCLLLLALMALSLSSSELKAARAENEEARIELETERGIGSSE